MSPRTMSPCQHCHYNIRIRSTRKDEKCLIPCVVRVSPTEVGEITVTRVSVSQASLYYFIGAKLTRTILMPYSTVLPFNIQ